MTWVQRYVTEPCIVLPLLFEVDETAFNAASATKQLAVYLPISQMATVDLNQTGIVGFNEIAPYAWWDSVNGDSIFVTTTPNHELITGMEYYSSPVSSQYGGPAAPVTQANTHGVFYVTSGLQLQPYYGPYARSTASGGYQAAPEALYGQYIPSISETHIMASGSGTDQRELVNRYNASGLVGSYYLETLAEASGGQVYRPILITADHVYVAERPGGGEFDTVSRADWTVVPNGGTVARTPLFTATALFAQIPVPSGAGAWGDVSIIGIYGRRGNGNLVVGIRSDTGTAGARGYLDANYLCEVTTSGTVVHAWPTVLRWWDGSFTTTYDPTIFGAASLKFDSTYVWHNQAVVDPNNDNIVYKIRFWDRLNTTSTPGRLTVTTIYQVDITTGSATPVGHFDARYLNEYGEYGTGYYFGGGGIAWVPSLSYITAITNANGGLKNVFTSFEP